MVERVFFDLEKIAFVFFDAVQAILPGFVFFASLVLFS